MDQLTKWDKFRLRVRQMGDGKAAVMQVTLVVDRNGDLECWGEPKCTRLEHAPASLGQLVKSLLDNV